MELNEVRGAGSDRGRSRRMGRNRRKGAKREGRGGEVEWEESKGVGRAGRRH